MKSFLIKFIKKTLSCSLILIVILILAKYYYDQYWQRQNINFLIETEQDSRIFPHKVNSVAKLQDLWQDGLRAFEVDLRFGDYKQDVFIVGHDLGDSNISFEQMLLQVEPAQIKKIWLDVKNLNKSNYQKVLKRLRYLDNLFNIKKKAIIETPKAEAFITEFTKAGWHMSYYMPNSLIANLWSKKDEDAMQELANKILQQVKAFEFSAISFTSPEYAYVNKYLSKSLPEDLVFHIWSLPPLRRPSFQADILDNQLYLDRRIKTLLTSYFCSFSCQLFYE